MNVALKEDEKCLVPMRGEDNYALPFTHCQFDGLAEAGAQALSSSAPYVARWIMTASSKLISLRPKCLRLVLLFAATAAGGDVHATEFKLERGSQLELCREMSANLKAFPDLLPQPFDMPFDPALENFGRVKWKSLDPLEHISKLRQISVYRKNSAGKKSAAEQEADWQAEKAALLKKSRGGGVALERAHFDANHDGKRENVYRFGQYKWPATYDLRGWVFAWNLFVMPEDDLKASRQWRRYAKGPLNPFYYKGRIFYLDPTGPAVYEPNEVREVKNLNLLLVCQFTVVE